VLALVACDGLIFWPIPIPDGDAGGIDVYVPDVAEYLYDARARGNDSTATFDALEVEFDAGRDGSPVVFAQTGTW
jgi:hypothetical protein